MTSRCYNKIKGLRTYTWQSFDSVHAHLLLPTKPLFIWSDRKAHLSQHMNFKFWNSPDWLKKLICVTVLQGHSSRLLLCAFLRQKRLRGLDPAKEPCFCFRHGCEGQLVWGFNSEWEWVGSNPLSKRGRRTYFIGTRIFPGDYFTHSTYYQAIPGTFDFQGLLHKITFFTCESKKYWIRKYQSNIRPMFQNVLNWHSITEYEINVKQWLCIKIQETEKDTHRCLQNVRRLPEAF